MASQTWLLHRPLFVPAKHAWHSPQPLSLGSAPAVHHSFIAAAIMQPQAGTCPARTKDLLFALPAARAWLEDVEFKDGMMIDDDESGANAGRDTGDSYDPQYCATPLCTILRYRGQSYDPQNCATPLCTANKAPSLSQKLKKLASAHAGPHQNASGPPLGPSCTPLDTNPHNTPHSKLACVLLSRLAKTPAGRLVCAS